MWSSTGARASAVRCCSCSGRIWPRKVSLAAYMRPRISTPPFTCRANPSFAPLRRESAQTHMPGFTERASHLHLHSREGKSRLSLERKAQKQEVPPGRCQPQDCPCRPGHSRACWRRQAPPAQRSPRWPRCSSSSRQPTHLIYCRHTSQHVAGHVMAVCAHLQAWLQQQQRRATLAH
jgi:hypothetical protein